MYTVGLKKTFIAQHYLIGDNSGPEYSWHSHPYELEVRVTGKELNSHGYLIDITELDELLNRITAQYQDSTLNELESFQGLNPSLEHFARIISQQILEEISTQQIQQLDVRLWEETGVWAEYRQSVR